MEPVVGAEEDTQRHPFVNIQYGDTRGIIKVEAHGGLGYTLLGALSINYNGGGVVGRRQLILDNHIKAQLAGLIGLTGLKGGP